MGQERVRGFTKGEISDIVRPDINSKLVKSEFICFKNTENPN